MTALSGGESLQGKSVEVTPYGQATLALGDREHCVEITDNSAGPASASLSGTRSAATDPKGLEWSPRKH